MWKIGLLVWYLLLLSIYDYKEKQVPVVLLYAGALVVVVFTVVEGVMGRITWHQILGIIPGVFMVMVSVVTKKVGMADGVVLAIIGIVLGYQSAMLLFCISLMLFSLISVILLCLHKIKVKTHIPYIPFLTAALLVQQIV